MGSLRADPSPHHAVNRSVVASALPAGRHLAADDQLGLVGSDEDVYGSSNRSLSGRLLANFHGWIYGCQQHICPVH
ncbi:hypothetical protein GUJ93_ZPchr0002g26055 [Zizania palustris]|uniref:Uncharacterized protein n=1 Tax=Zizania palustris TaxID=103762 RepID=A0A8J5VS30_ZIZPA|nr:hypothetical protein GUJ93_ZPchr0002g26055 [Zizania palustris]